MRFPLLLPRFALLAFLLLAGREGLGAVPFKLRARVTQIQGAAPINQSFTYSIAWGKGLQVESAGPAWSEWLTCMNGELGKTILSVGGVKNPTDVEVEIVFDANPKTVFSLRGELYGGRLGIMFERSQLTNNRFSAKTMAGFNRRYWEPLQDAYLTPDARPQKLLFIDRFIGGDQDLIAWREGITNLMKVGFNVIMVPPNPVMRKILNKNGMTRTAWAVYCPPGYAFDHGIADPDAVLAKWAQGEANTYIQAGFNVKDLSFFAMSDEPGWYLPAAFKGINGNNKRVHDRFVSYLQDHDLSRDDLGLAAWEDAKAIGVSKAVSLPAKRLYYWTVRFLAWDSSRYFGRATAALEDAFYPGLPISCNFNNFKGRLYCKGPIFNNRDKQSPDAAMMQHDWLEFGRLRGSTLLWTEDWFRDEQASQWSYYCARLNSAARKSGVNFGGYVIPRMAGDQIHMKTLAVIGCGGKAIKYFTFGPEYNFPGNCYSDKSSVQVFPSLVRAHRMIAKAEDVLYPGKRNVAEVAMLYPQSAQPWDPSGIADATITDLKSRTVGYMCEIFCQYLHMQRHNIPVDFVDELDLNREALSPYKVLYVTTPNVPVELHQPLFDWVEAGGTLVTVAGTGQADRYDVSTDRFFTAGGISETRTERRQIRHLETLPVVAKGTGAFGEFKAIGTRSKGIKHDGIVLSAFADGSPAIIRQPIGKGSHIHFAFFPGIANEHPTGRGKLAKALSYPCIQAGVVPDVVLSGVAADQEVEAPLLISEKGAALTLLNWTREPVKVLSVAVRVPFNVKTVESVTQGAIAFRTTETGVIFTLPLADADVVALRP